MMQFYDKLKKMASNCLAIATLVKYPTQYPTRGQSSGSQDQASMTSEEQGCLILKTCSDGILKYMWMKLSRRCIRKLRGVAQTKYNYVSVYFESLTFEGG